MALLRDAVLYRDDCGRSSSTSRPGWRCRAARNTERHVDALLDGLRFDSDERPRLVHRLDKDTSGVLLIARHAARGGVLHARLSRQDDTQDLLGDRRRRAEIARRAASIWRCQRRPARGARARPGR